MNSKFHGSLNRMALFTALIIVGAVLARHDLLRIASANIWLNGIILGTTVFGVIVAFTDIFKLLPEYKWMKRFFAGSAQAKEPRSRRSDSEGGLPPATLRPIAIMLNKAKAQRKNFVSAPVMNGFLGLIQNRFEDQRDQLRYLSNTLIFLGLLGTFWGLIHTISGFADFVGVLNFNDENVMSTMQTQLAHPLAGMGTAFSASLLGLAGSLIVGFLNLQTTIAQNALFRELEENLAEKTRLPKQTEIEAGESNINAAVKDLTAAVGKLEKALTKIKT